MAFRDGPQAVTTATLTSIAELQNPIPYVASGFGVREKNPWARIMMRQTPMAVALYVGWGCQMCVCVCVVRWSCGWFCGRYLHSTQT